MPGIMPRAPDLECASCAIGSNPLRLLLTLLAWLPLPVLHALGDALGTLLWLLPNSLKRIALRNIRACLPELDERAVRRLARRSLVHQVKAVLDMPMIWVGPARRVLALVKEHRNPGVVDEALARGKGMILLTLHQGSFEAVALPFSAKHPAHGIYKPQPGTIDAMAFQGRTRFGGQLLPAEGGVSRRCVEILARGETVYFMPDQDPPEGRGVFAPFFGIPAHTPTLVWRLARESGAPVVFFWGERLPRGRGFIAHWHHAPPEIQSEDVQVSVAAMNRALEQCVREGLEQYWWSYKRFRRQPPGVPRFYPKGE